MYLGVDGLPLAAVVPAAHVLVHAGVGLPEAAGLFDPGGHDVGGEVAPPVGAVECPAPALPLALAEGVALVVGGEPLPLVPLPLEVAHHLLHGLELVLHLELLIADLVELPVVDVEVGDDLVVEVLHGRLEGHAVQLVGDGPDQLLRDYVVYRQDLRHHLLQLVCRLVNLLEVGVVGRYQPRKTVLRLRQQLRHLLLEVAAQFRHRRVQRRLEPGTLLLQLGQGALGGVPLVVEFVEAVADLLDVDGRLGDLLVQLLQSLGDVGHGYLLLELPDGLLDLLLDVLNPLGEFGHLELELIPERPDLPLEVVLGCFDLGGTLVPLIPDLLLLGEGAPALGHRIDLVEQELHIGLQHLQFGVIGRVLPHSPGGLLGELPVQNLQVQLGLLQLLVDGAIEMPHHIPQLLVFGVRLQAQLLQAGVEVVVQPLPVRLLVDGVAQLAQLSTQLLEALLHELVLLSAHQLHLLADQVAQALRVLAHGVELFNRLRGGIVRVGQVA